MDKMLKRREAAAYLGIPYLTLQYWGNMKKNEIPYAKYGRHAMYRQSDLDEFIESRMVVGF